MYGIMRIEKRSRPAVASLQKEANRTADDHARGVDFNHSDIDWSKTDQNVHLVRTENWNKAISARLRAEDLKERKNSIVMLDGLYSASAEWYEGKTQEEIFSYFRDCLDFHIREYCGGDPSLVINAVVHLDETHLHMQVASVPICEDEKGKHLSARIIMGNKADYRKRQDRFYEEVTKKRGLARGEVKDAAHRRRHLAVQDYKAMKLSEEISRKEETLDRLKEETDAAVKEITEDSCSQLKELEQTIRAADPVQDRPGLMLTVTDRKEIKERVRQSKLNSEEIVMQKKDFNRLIRSDAEKDRVIKTMHEQMQRVRDGLKEMISQIQGKTRSWVQKILAQGVRKDPAGEHSRKIENPAR